MSIGSRWRNFRTGVRGIRIILRLVRVARLMRRALDLRDRGKLEEALAVCRRALAVAGSGTDANLLRTLAVTTLAFQEIASMLGQPALASERLESALRALESGNRTNADRPSEDLLRTERQVRARLVELRSAN